MLLILGLALIVLVEDDETVEVTEVLFMEPVASGLDLDVLHKDPSCLVHRVHQHDMLRVLCEDREVILHSGRRLGLLVTDVGSELFVLLGVHNELAMSNGFLDETCARVDVPLNDLIQTAKLLVAHDQDISNLLVRLFAELLDIQMHDVPSEEAPCQSQSIGSCAARPEHEVAQLLLLWYLFVLLHEMSQCRLVRHVLIMGVHDRSGGVSLIDLGLLLPFLLQLLDRIERTVLYVLLH